MHLNLTLDSLCYHLYYSCRQRLSNYVELITKYDPQRGSIDHMTPHKLDQNHSILIQTIPSSQKKDSRLLVTASSVIMIVVYFAKVITPYPRVVISSLAKRL
jgi:hypothetical protein